MLLGLMDFLFEALAPDLPEDTEELGLFDIP
jgi:hypothetical protein